jgi:hypothetical protein
MSRLIPINEKTGVNSYAVIDNEDYEKVSKYRWYFNTRGYVITDIWQKDTKKNKRILLHRMIMNISDPKVFIDHMNHDILDNRKENLRLCSNKENNRNSIGQKQHNGYKGVYQTLYNSWNVAIVVDAKNISLGTYYNEKDAALVYDQAARKYFKEFAYLNFPEITNYSHLNKPRRHPNRTSKYIGISYNKKAKKWRVEKTYNHKKYYLGEFDTQDKALQVLNQFCQERGLVCQQEQ